jgi:osmoprotectant transport system permease protein
MTPLLGQTSRPFPDWDWIGANADVIGRLTVAHVQLTVVAVLLGLAIAMPLAVAASRWPLLRTPMLAFTGVLFTIPSVALFVLLLGYAGTGLTRTTALIGLTIYTLLILVRNTLTGLTGVAPDIREAADAMGFRRARRLVQVELPLALPVVMAGVRIATVTTIGLVVISTVIGVDNLGRLMLQLGFERRNLTAAITGFVLVVLLAVVADLLLVATERLLTPWQRRHREAA